MKSNIQKIADRVQKLLKTNNQIIIIPKSHNQLNQIDIALKRIGIHGDKDWSPRLARALTTSDAKLGSWRVLGDFDGGELQATVWVYKNGNKCISAVHNHDCSVKVKVKF